MAARIIWTIFFYKSNITRGIMDIWPEMLETVVINWMYRMLSEAAAVGIFICFYFFFSNNNLIIFISNMCIRFPRFEHTAYSPFMFIQYIPSKQECLCYYEFIQDRVNHMRCIWYSLVFVHKFQSYLVVCFLEMFNAFICFRRIKLLTPVSLAVENVGRDDKGSYQCLITSKKNSAQAIAELKLGGKYQTRYIFSIHDLWNGDMLFKLNKIYES